MCLGALALSVRLFSLFEYNALTATCRPAWLWRAAPFLVAFVICRGAGARRGSGVDQREGACVPVLRLAGQIWTGVLVVVVVAAGVLFGARLIAPFPFFSAR